MYTGLNDMSLIVSGNGILDHQLVALFVGRGFRRSGLVGGSMSLKSGFGSLKTPAVFLVSSLCLMLLPPRLLSAFLDSHPLEL